METADLHHSTLGRGTRCREVGMAKGFIFHVLMWGVLPVLFRVCTQNSIYDPLTSESPLLSVDLWVKIKVLVQRLYRIRTQSGKVKPKSHCVQWLLI